MKNDNKSNHNIVGVERMRLKELRECQGLSQTELASKLGIKRVTYNKYELENNEPDIKTMMDIANYFGVSLDYLCGRQFNSKIGYIPEDRVDLIKVIANLPDKDFAQISNYVKGYVDGKTSSNDLDFYTNDEKVEIKNYDRR